jgi:transposase
MDEGRPRSDDARRAEIAALRAQGLTLREIADLLGVSPAWIAEFVGRSPLTEAQAAARRRFPGFPRDLAAALAARFPDEAALRAATDEELLGLRDMGLWRLARLRKRHPRP